MILAAIGARLLGQPIEDHLPKTHTDALAKLPVDELKRALPDAA